MSIRILGVCGSPIPGGNTEVFLERALEVAGALDGVDVERVALAGKEIRDCRHCNWCVAKQTEEKFCVVEDDMAGIFPRILAADALLLATPVYIGRLSGYLATFMDRLRVFIHGNVHKARLVDKVGGALAVGWFRHAGLETALQTVVVGFLTCQMIPVNGIHCPWGAPAVATLGGTGRFDKTKRHGVLEDELGLRGAEALARRAVAVARKLKAEF